MKQVQLKILTSAILIAGMTAGSATAGVVGSGAPTGENPGSACEAYYPSQAANLANGTSMLVASAPAWAHCQVVGDALDATATEGIAFHIDAPTGGVANYNCYVATMGKNTNAADYEWVTGAVFVADSADPIDELVSTAAGAGVDVPAPAASNVDATDVYTTTSGCLLHANQRLVSVTVD